MLRYISPSGSLICIFTCYTVDDPRFHQTSTVIEVQPNQPENIPVEKPTQPEKKKEKNEKAPIHQNVLCAPSEENRPVSIYGVTTLSSLLRDYNVDFDYKRGIFVQIVHALIFMQDYHRSHKGIDAEEIYFSRDCKCATVSVSKGQTGTLGKKTDVKLLKDLFCKIFSIPIAKSKQGNSCLADKAIALNLRDGILKNHSHLQRILEHPFFWGYEKKLNFLIKMCEELKAGNGKLQELFNDEWNRKFTGAGFNWFTLLILRRDEISQLPEAVSTSKVRDEAMCSELGEFDPAKLFDLLRFIRNHKIHFPKSPIKDCFLNDSTQYWLFYSRRFPDLFMYVYEFAKEPAFKDGRLVSVYFKPACPYSFLTDFKQPVKKVHDH